MNKSELVDKVADTSSVSKRDVESVVAALFDTVKGAARAGDPVSWPGFGSFKSIQREARTGRDPRTRKPMKIAAKKVVKFTPSSTFKDFLNAKGTTKKASPATKAAGKKASPAKKTAAKKAPARKAAKTTKNR